jgi:hypothetical protein
MSASAGQDPEKSSLVQGSLSDLYGYKKKAPFRCRFIHWDKGRWFLVVGKAPLGVGEFYGYMDNGCGVGFQDDQGKSWMLLK